MSSVRLRRLAADFDRLSEFIRRHPRLRLLQTQGDPPERYELQYRLKSLRQSDTELVEVKEHVVEISLPRNYPRTPPVCRMLTPVFHPNIAPHAICIGDHWSAGEPLWRIVARIGEMIAFQSYNTKSPLNGDAARWVDEHIDRLPLDSVSMILQEDPSATSADVPTPEAIPQSIATPGDAASEDVRPEPAAPAREVAEPDASERGEPQRVTPAPDAGVKIQIECPNCHTRYVAPARAVARRARCRHCQTIIQVPAWPAEP